MKLILIIVVLLPAVCPGATVVSTITAPDNSISGLAWGEDRLWALDELSSYVYCLNPETGDVEMEFYVNESHGINPRPTGLAYSNGTLFIASIAGSTSYIYFYSTSGNYLGYEYLC